MSETVVSIERDTKSGRFVSGNSGGPGRKKGSRNACAEAFLRDALMVWQERGIEALRMTAATEPARFCQIMSSLLPRELDVAVEHDVRVEVRGLLESFRSANIRIDGEVERMMKRLLAAPAVIDADAE
jgi:hypothetical protein